MSEKVLAFTGNSLMELLETAYMLGAHRGVTVFAEVVLITHGVPPPAAFDALLATKKTEDLREMRETLIGKESDEGSETGCQ